MQYINDTRKSLTKHLHSDSANIGMYKKNQRVVVEQWYPASKEATSLLIPPLSMRDDIKTVGYGIAIIEILCITGVLSKVSSYGGGHI